MARDFFLSFVVLVSLFCSSLQQACPQFCVCTNSGTITLTCTSLTSVPTILTQYKGLILDFANGVDIPGGSFRNLIDIQTIQLTGDIGKIATGAFENVKGKNGSSEIRIAANINTIETEAFKGITGFQNLRLTYCRIQTIGSSAFKSLEIYNLRLTDADILTLNSYAFDDVAITVKFEATKCSFGTIQPCGFGGMMGASEFKIQFSTINATTKYPFGGLQHVIFFTLESVSINFAAGTTLRGMNSVRIDPDIQSNGNAVPATFSYDGTTSSDVLANIRQICLGDTITLTSSQPASITPVPSRLVSQSTITAATTANSKVTNIPNSSVIKATGVTATTTTTLSPSVIQSNLTTQPTASTSTTSSSISTTTTDRDGGLIVTPVSSASKEYAIQLSDIIMIIILVVLVIIIILLVLIVIMYKSRGRDKVAPEEQPETRNSYYTGYDARGKASQLTPTREGGLYYIKRDSKDHLVPIEATSSDSEPEPRRHSKKHSKKKVRDEAPGTSKGETTITPKFEFEKY